MVSILLLVLRLRVLPRGAGRLVSVLHVKTRVSLVPVAAVGIVLGRFHSSTRDKTLGKAEALGTREIRCRVSECLDNAGFLFWLIPKSY